MSLAFRANMDLRPPFACPSQRRSWALGLAAALLCAAAGDHAGATITDPALALSRAAVTSGATARLVHLEGALPDEDLVQLAYPLQLLIWSGANYVRYETGGEPVEGQAPQLADGLDPDEAIALLGHGAPSAGARIAFLGPGRIDVLLPATFPPGEAQAQLFVVEGADVLLSNPIPFAVPGEQP